MKKISVLTGAGISAESGLKTFRDAGGLWEGHNVYDVATFDAWQADPGLVLDFYNMRRKDVKNAHPNNGHLALNDLEAKFEVTVVTQNVDDLHERAGSKNVMHLHGEILKVRSTINDHLIYDWTEDLSMGDKCEQGSQLRPHIVWFGEMVPMIETASRLVSKSDIFIVIGTSMLVYPAAGLIQYISPDCPVYVVDPKLEKVQSPNPVRYYTENASTGVPKLVKKLMDEAS